jgi:hypothetical protein
MYKEQPLHDDFIQRNKNVSGSKMGIASYDEKKEVISKFQKRIQGDFDCDRSLKNKYSEIKNRAPDAVSMSDFDDCDPLILEPHMELSDYGFSLYMLFLFFFFLQRMKIILPLKDMFFRITRWILKIWMKIFGWKMKRVYVLMSVKSDMINPLQLFLQKNQIGCGRLLLRWKV